MICHNSDHGISAGYSPPSHIVHLFSQNASSNDPRVTCLPIGIPNSMHGDLGNTDYITRILKTPRILDKTLYVSFTSKPGTLRASLIEKFKEKNYATVTGNGKRILYNRYVDNIYRHRFMLSPPGNGKDCHRTWESLYLKCIPIVLKDPMYDAFDLPILQVDDFDIIEKAYLDEKYAQLLEQKFNFEQLSFQYWKDKICQATLKEH